MEIHHCLQYWEGKIRKLNSIHIKKDKLQGFFLAYNFLYISGNKTILINFNINKKLKYQCGFVVK